jgi:thymidylate synthase
MQTVSDIRQVLKDKLSTEDFVVDKTRVKMVEILNANFIADKDIIFGNHSPNWYKRELNWYRSQSLNVNDIEEPIPEIWKQVADKDGFINSNYGWMIFSTENINQYLHCLAALIEHKDTRRGEMIYTRPSMQTDFNLNGRSDFCCCQFTQHLIRNDVLTLHSFWRSSDLIHGYKSDYQWMKFVHEKLYDDLLETYPDLELGPIYWNAGSAHIYEYHFHLIGDNS